LGLDALKEAGPVKALLTKIGPIGIERLTKIGEISKEIYQGYTVLFNIIINRYFQLQLD
jgi:hypothetical protein